METDTYKIGCHPPLEALKICDWEARAVPQSLFSRVCGRAPLEIVRKSEAGRVSSRQRQVHEDGVQSQGAERTVDSENKPPL